MNLQMRLDIERQIRNLCVDTLINAGYKLSVDDGENETPKSSNASKIKSWMATTDEDYLWVWKASSVVNAGFIQSGCVRFIYGNYGYDVIADHSTSLKEVLKPVFELADKIGEQYANSN